MREHGGVFPDNEEALRALPGVSAALSPDFGGAAARSASRKPAMLAPMAVVAPSLLLPALLGMKVYVGISPAAFRNIVLGLQLTRLDRYADQFVAECQRRGLGAAVATAE